jgi:hypothetical protein
MEGSGCIDISSTFRQRNGLFVNMFKTLYYEYVMGSSAQQFTNAVVVAKCIKQGIINGRIFELIEKKGFGRKKNDVDHIKGGYRDKKNHFQNYNTPSPSP